MKILLLAPQPFYVERGTPIAVRLLIRALCEAGHEVDLLTYAQGEDVDIPGCTIHRIPKLPFLGEVGVGFSVKKLVCDAFMFPKAMKMAWQTRYDVIHAVEESVYIAQLLAPFVGAKVVYDMDSSMADQLVEKWSGLRAINPFLQWFERLAVRRADLVLPVCTALGDKVKLHDPRAYVHVLEDVALDSDEAAPLEESLRDSLGIDERLMLLYVGNLEHYQGIDLLLDSMRGLDEPVDLVVIGGDPKSVAHYREVAGETNVHFVGPRPVKQLMHYLEQADMLVSPRIKGTNTPMKVYSYLASGKPVLATGIQSHTQVLDPSVAYLVEPNPAALAQGIAALAANPAERQALGERGAARVRERHSYEAFRTQLQKAYEPLK